MYTAVTVNVIKQNSLLAMLAALCFSMVILEKAAPFLDSLQIPESSRATFRFLSAYLLTRPIRTLQLRAMADLPYCTRLHQPPLIGEVCVWGVWLHVHVRAHCDSVLFSSEAHTLGKAARASLRCETKRKFPLFAHL